MSKPEPKQSKMGSAINFGCKIGSMSKNRATAEMKCAQQSVLAVRSGL